MTALDLTRSDLIGTLRRIGRRPAVDGAVKAKAEGLAARIAEAGGVAARASRRGAGDYVVTVSGPGLFAREFGGVDQAPRPVIGPAVQAATSEGGRAAKRNPASPFAPRVGTSALPGSPPSRG
jgi:hypothetical protein